MVTLLCSVIFIADSIERMILSTLPYLCKCQWDLTSVEEAALTSLPTTLDERRLYLEWGQFY